MIETEIKFFLGDEAAARSVVAAAGLAWIDGEYEINRLFDTPEGRLRREGSLVRLRTRGGKTWLTYKQKTAHSDGIAKLRIEHEMAVSSHEAAGEFLAGIGLVETLRYDKYRAEYVLEGAMLVVDHLPGGWFCEVEGEGAALESAAIRLGLESAMTVTLTYPEICHKLYQNNDLPDLCWIFCSPGHREPELPAANDSWWYELPETT